MLEASPAPIAWWSSCRALVGDQIAQVIVAQLSYAPVLLKHRDTQKEQQECAILSPELVKISNHSALLSTSVYTSLK